MFGKKGLLERLTKRAQEVHKHSRRIIIFPELDDKIVQACSILIKKGIADPLILGTPSDIVKICEKNKIKNIKEEHMLDYSDEKHKNQHEEFAQKYLEMRKKDGKEIALDEAKSKMSQSHFYGGMMVHLGLASGMISGINSATKPYYPAFEIVKTREGISRASGLFIMSKAGKEYFFADCALNIDPSPSMLAEIAQTSAQTAIGFGIKPRIAMLSFSTRDSAKHPLVEKVKEATKILKSKDSELIFDGEIQLDAAIVPEVFKKKCSDSPLQGEANILIFPDLNAGNIGYKLVERLAGYKAIGPIMQGLNQPINDLSRGCSVQDIVDVSVITVIQSMEQSL